MMPANTELWKAHDLAQRLQDKLELLPNVERAFVHVDHETEHRPVRFLEYSVSLCLKILSPVGTSKICLNLRWGCSTCIHTSMQKSAGFHRQVPVVVLNDNAFLVLDTCVFWILVYIYEMNIDNSC